MKPFIKHIKTPARTIVLISSFVVATILGCANRGQGPQGGPKDTTPPVLVSATPENGATNVSTDHIEFVFNELVLVENQSENVIVSPPQKKPLEIKALGRKVIVNIKDSLRDSTTYTIHFGNAIVDNNEKNQFKDFTYRFATGSEIDSLKIAGYVIDAATLTPIKGIIVGVHRDTSDTAFTKKIFDFITKSNDDGRFEVSNIPSGKYHLFALQDIGSNFRFDIPTEQIAFHDSLLIPKCDVDLKVDTIWRDSICCDTIPIEALAPDSFLVVCDTTRIVDSIAIHRSYTYTPDSVILRAFIEKSTRKYLARSERPERYLMQFIWGASIDSMPRITPLEISDSAWHVVTRLNSSRDTLRLWLTDSTLINRDTISIQIEYEKHVDDSLLWQVDTLTMLYRAPRQNKKQRASTPTETKLLVTNIKSDFDLFRQIELRLEMPSTLRLDDGCHLQTLRDSTWSDLPIELQQADSTGMLFVIGNKLTQGETYRLKIDSATFVSCTGKTNDADSIQFKVKSIEDYAKLILTLKGHSGNEIIEIIDAQERVIASAKASSTPVVIEYIAPGTYYLRAFDDLDFNGELTTGKYADKRQPETVYYYPYSIEMRAFWDVEEEWDLKEESPLNQRPPELKAKSK